MDHKALFVEACNNQSKGDLGLAITQLNQLLLYNPNFVPAWNNRAAMLQKLGHPFDAIMNYDRALSIHPDSEEVFNNRGAAYMDLNLFDKAIEDFDRATVRNPKLAEAFNNKGNTFVRMGKIKEAAENYRRATEVRPSYADGHLGLSLSLLKLGEFEEGWKEFEWRWRTKHLEPRGLNLPEWDGSSAKSSGAGLLLYGEQGLGDVLQFMRYAALAKEKWRGKVYVEVSYPVTRLAETLKGIDGIITLGSRIPENVVACAPLMSCPRILWPVYKGIPSECPYVYPDPHRVSLWKQKLTALPPGVLVGICWAGMNRDNNPMASSIDARRSMALEQFRPLTMLKNISWVSLQLGPPSEQLKRPPTGMTAGDWSSELYDFYDTAALIECLDLVITVDTAVAHVAGALGKPTWMLSRFDGCWRWLINRSDTKWYPSMRIFNQTTDGDWAEVIDRVEVSLRNYIKIKSPATKVVAA